MLKHMEILRSLSSAILRILTLFFIEAWLFQKCDIDKVYLNKRNDETDNEIILSSYWF